MNLQEHIRSQPSKNASKALQLIKAISHTG